MDVNDNQPAFAQQLYAANVSAGVTQGMERTIAKLEAKDIDAGRFGQVNYRIIDVKGGPATSFRYDSNTHELKAVGPLVAGQKYQVTLEAVDGGGLVGRTAIWVHAVADQATGWPLTNMQVTPMYAVPAATTVIPSTYNRRIPSLPALRAIEEPTEKLEAFVERLNEATPANSIVFNLGDENTRGINKYFRILHGNEDGKFAMNEETGTVTTVSSFDREQKDIYTLSIEARSREPDQLLYYTVLQVYITDANDNAPEFEGSQPIKLDLKLDDLSQLGPNWKIGRVLVHDKDKDENGRISLRILEPLNQLFTIEHNGDLSINGELTSQHLGEHRLSVIATDNGDPPLESRALILISIEGMHPVYPPLPCLPLRFPVLQIAYDQAPIPIVYQSRDLQQLFHPLHLLRATLPPSMVNSNTDAPPFTRIDPRTGSFQSIVSTTSNGVPLPIYSPHSTISNSPDAPYYTSSVPPPDRIAPIFTNPLTTVVVEENDEDLELCTLVAKYPDGQPGPVTYVMQTGDETLFSLNNHTGKLILLKALDAEAEQTYSLTVGTLESMVNNQGLTMDPNQPHSATIVVQVMDLNDWIPNFEQDLYEFKVIDKAEPSTVVGQVTAYDQDAKPQTTTFATRF
uniref:Cadherin domain-containing protein n=1 Tax=Ditylenchus dipsaci TaxID=166011 RepID=A0A915D3A9_9BILA